ncbi:hypothetical protein PPUJ21368_36050 [Pseudomonas putida]|nr:hypothetical protein PPUJ21368_36050 [Pseudomonas putida]
MLEGGQRLFQRQLAVLQALDQCLQVCEGLLEIEGGFFAGHGDFLGGIQNGATLAERGGGSKLPTAARLIQAALKRAAKRPCPEDQAGSASRSSIASRYRASSSMVSTGKLYCRA